jgi:hypothetical protein
MPEKGQYSFGLYQVQRIAGQVILPDRERRAASPNAPFRSRLWKFTTEPGQSSLRASIMVHARPWPRPEPRQSRRCAIVSR